MERNAHYAVVGLVSTLLLIGLAIFTVWLARVQFSKQYDVYDVDFKGPVRGLSSGGEVYFNGIRVGEVTKLSLDRTNPNRVVARVRVSADAPVRVDSTASLEPLGITGVNYIQITAGTITRPLLKDATPDDQVPVIRTVRGALESLLEGGGTVLARAVDALDRVNKLLSDENMASVSGTFKNIEEVTAEFKTHKILFKDLDAMVNNLNGTIERINKLADSSDKLVNEDARKLLGNLSETAGELKVTAAEARTMVANLQGPTTEFATTGLPQITASVVSMQAAVDSLGRLVDEIEKNPSGLISKPPAKTIEVKP
jgi:phospholipid/cholesterol/gamma-HCH transport system substrate-binding protein